MNEGKLNEFLSDIREVQLAKERSTLLVGAKQNMLLLALTNNASPEEVEKARQELIDAIVASVDAGIDAFKSAYGKYKKA